MSLAILALAAALVVTMRWRTTLARQIGSLLGSVASFLRRVIRKPPVGDWAEAAVRFRGAHRLRLRPRPGTKGAGRSGGMIKLYVVPVLGFLPLEGLGPMQIQDLYASLLARGLSGGTVLNLHLALTNAFGQAVRWGLLLTNPAAGAQPPRPRRPGRIRILVASIVILLACLIAALTIPNDLRRVPAGTISGPHPDCRSPGPCFVNVTDHRLGLRLSILALGIVVSAMLLLLHRARSAGGWRLLSEATPER